MERLRHSGMKRSAALVPLLLLLSACGTSTDVSLGAGGDADEGGEKSAVHAACPATPEQGLPAAAEPIPRGATAARVCVYDVDTGQGRPPVPRPAVANGEEAATFSDALATAAAKPGDLVCTMELGPTAQVLLAYEDGSTRLAVVEMYGCGNVRLSTGGDVLVVPSPAGAHLRQALVDARTQSQASPGPTSAGDPSADPDTPVSAPSQ